MGSGAQERPAGREGVHGASGSGSVAGASQGAGLDSGTREHPAGREENRPGITPVGCDLDVFVREVGSIYDKVVQWRRNLFIVPYGAAGAEFVRELANYIQAFADGTSLSSISWKAVCVMCHLLLQKPNDSKILKNHSEHLRRRLDMWRSGRVLELFDECQCIQSHMPSRHSGMARHGGEKSDVTFSNLVLSGKMHSAIRYLSESPGGVLMMDDPVDSESDRTVRDVLLEKHPEPLQPDPSALLEGDPLDVNPILFERITPELIRYIGRRLKGSSGPSGLDADAWCRMLTCFQADSNRLCTALAAAARLLCTAECDSAALEGLVAARLIPLDKQPGVRPIAVGEVHRRIMGRAIMKVVEPDVQATTAPRQVCVGVPSACEASVHAIHHLFSMPDTEGVLLVDASNAFNSLNRKAALHNVARVCPALARVFSNTYGKPIRLFVSGGGEILSREGTCQGDPLAMAVYAVAITPLIRQLAESCPEATQLWYADDDAAVGRIAALAQYWRRLKEKGPAFGYYPKASKTILITKPDKLQAATEQFAGTGIEVTVDGSPYLGGAVGSADFCRRRQRKQAEGWISQIEVLSGMAVTQPQAAYAVFTQGLSSQWLYAFRCLPWESGMLEQMDDIINSKFIPAITGHQFPADGLVRELLSFPVRDGGLAIPSIACKAQSQYCMSMSITQPLTELLVANVGPTQPGARVAVAVDAVRANARSTRKAGVGRIRERLAEMVGSLDVAKQRLCRYSWGEGSQLVAHR